MILSSLLPRGLPGSGGPTEALGKSRRLGTTLQRCEAESSVARRAPHGDKAERRKCVWPWLGHLQAVPMTVFSPHHPLH